MKAKQPAIYSLQWTNEQKRVYQELGHVTSLVTIGRECNLCIK